MNWGDTINSLPVLLLRLMILISSNQCLAHITSITETMSTELGSLRDFDECSMLVKKECLCE